MREKWGGWFVRQFDFSCCHLSRVGFQNERALCPIKNNCKWLFFPSSFSFRNATNGRSKDFGRRYGANPEQKYRTGQKFVSATALGKSIVVSEKRPFRFYLQLIESKILSDMIVKKAAAAARKSKLPSRPGWASIFFQASLLFRDFSPTN